MFGAKCSNIDFNNNYCKQFWWVKKWDKNHSKYQIFSLNLFSLAPTMLKSTPFVNVCLRGSLRLTVPELRPPASRRSSLDLE